MKQWLFLGIFISLAHAPTEAFFGSSQVAPSLWQRVKKTVNCATDSISINNVSKFFAHPATQQAFKKYAFQAKKMISHAGDAIDYGYLGAIALYPFIDRYCMSNAPAWMASDVSPQFKTFVQNELRAAGVNDTQKLYVKYSSLADAHMAVSFSRGIVVSKNLHDVWHELKGLPYKNQQENESLFKALIDLDSDMIRFIIRREATHMKHKDYLKRTAFLMGLFALGKWSEYGRRSHDSSDQSWKKLLGHWTINRLKNMAYLGTGLLAYSRFAVPQEARADMQAASTQELAEAGSGLFEQMGTVEEVVMGERLYAFFEKYPALYQMLLFNKRSQKRAECLQERAEYFEKLN